MAAKYDKKSIQMEKILIIFTIALFAIIVLTGCSQPPSNIAEESNNTKTGNIMETAPEQVGEITVEGAGRFEFEPDIVQTVRTDIFKKEHFSVFDILVHLNKQDKINMEYHFNESMNTYVIDSINGEPDWWYMAYYDGGWPENNVFRMDHYPYKDKMYIRIEKYDNTMLGQMYKVFQEEKKKKKLNSGKIIIPEVIINGPKTDVEFKDVEVTPHNLRKDIFREDTITAIDTILTLGDEEKLKYNLKWYESIGRAVVKSYWVEGLNKDIAFGRCGFVYESGDRDYEGFRGNHIHLPSDTRVLNSPEYLEYFWICL